MSSLYGDEIFFNENYMYNRLMESINMPINEGIDVKAKITEIKNRFLEFLRKIKEKIKELINKVKSNLFKTKVKSEIEREIKKEEKKEEKEVFIVCNFGNLDNIKKYINQIEGYKNKVEGLDMHYVLKGSKGARYVFDEPINDKEKTGDDLEDLMNSLNARAGKKYHIEGDPYQDYCHDINIYIKKTDELQEEIKNQFKDENWFNSSNNISVSENSIETCVKENSIDIDSILRDTDRQISSIETMKSLKSITRDMNSDADEQSLLYGHLRVATDVIKFYTTCLNCLNIITTNIFKYKIKDEIHNVMRTS